MTTATSTPTTPGTARRMLALARTEGLLLTRNRIAIYMALAMPLCLIGVLRQSLKSQHAQLPGGDLHSALLLSLYLTVLLFVVYYNLTAAYVARRNDLVLKRLRTGELTDLEIFAGTALPGLLLALLQMVAMTVGVAALVGLPAPRNPLLVVVGLLLALAVLVPLAALSSAFTKSVETSGITTLPVMMLTMFGSGLLVPFSVFSGPVLLVPRLLPTTPALALLRTGWLGSDGAHHPMAWWLYLPVALAWAALAVWAARRWFRWEPRR
ncbi:ABC transporter permease [Kitasatospora viridis]|uniref:ABC-2 type transport system permease protein n=1 Tax=Kitasatospora viridis TaxID=281105 RepID=A0A561UHP0_9ACTN|nr:ABC transporter permease [Kitasatospora viridis]TWF98876.1 ABC-2 type transport system permease protein [Kitasatospora viridis]